MQRPSYRAYNTDNQMREKESEVKIYLGGENHMVTEITRFILRPEISRRM
jgi:hypothetical protein